MKRSSMTVKIPKGIEDGASLRMRGEGEAGEQGAPPGDLFVHVKQEPDPRFTRKGDDLWTTIPISFAQAALGAKVPLATFAEDLTIHIFDILYLNNEDLRNRKLSERTITLKSNVIFNSRIRSVQRKTASTMQDIEKIFREAINQGMEGIVVK